MPNSRNKFPISLRIALCEFMKWRNSYHIWVTFAALIVLTSIKVNPIRAYAIGHGLSVSNWFFCFQFSDGITCMLFYYAVSLLFCNAPFVDRQQLFMLIRSGRKNWCVGEVIYILISSMIYFGVIAILDIVMFVPYVGFSSHWETVFTAIANGTVYGLNLPIYLIENYTPASAFVLTYLVNVGIATMIGLLIYFINMGKGKGFGSAVVIAWITFSNLITMFPILFKWAKYISPISWTSLSRIGSGESKVPMGYVASFLLLFDLILVIGIRKRGKRYALEASEEI